MLLEAESTPVKRGGEGAIHRIISGTGPPLVAKLWHFPQKNVSSQQRIQWMIEHSPVKNVSANVQNAIIWPQDLVFRNRKPAGYTMSLVPESIKLFSFIQPQFPDPKWDQKWQKFSVDNGFRNRLTVCYNLAQTVDFIHKSGNYQLVDMKPENILVKPNGHISLIDLDSIQIRENGSVLFPATVFTPEYSPPEFHQRKFTPGVTEFSSQHDQFSLAVILYQILVNVHPYQASHPKNTAVHQNIADALWVHGPRKKELHRIPYFHDFFHQLPQPLQALFHQTFGEGHASPQKRTTASQWASTLLKAIHAEKNAPKRRHRYKPKSQPRKTSAKKSKEAPKTEKQINQTIQVVGNNNVVTRITNNIINTW